MCFIQFYTGQRSHELDTFFALICLSDFWIPRVANKWTLKTVKEIFKIFWELL